MKMRFIKISSIAIAAVSTLLLGSCGADPDSPGLEYMPDMYRSPAVEPYVDYAEVRNVINEEATLMVSAKTPPFGTVPYYGTDSTTVSMMLPYARLANKSFKMTHGMYEAELSTENTYELAAADGNMLALTDENAEQIFADGKYIYNSKCAHCHGKKGDGNGPMVESGAYVGVPDYANLTELSDGQMFYSIYYGKGMMGAHGPLLNKKEIWTVVHYIRQLQDADYGPGSVQQVADVEDAEADDAEANDAEGNE